MRFETEDEAFDRAQQELLDAFMEGQQAGRLNLPASRCPYMPFEPAYNEWQRGRMLVIGQQLLRRSA